MASSVAPSVNQQGTTIGTNLVKRVEKSHLASQAVREVMRILAGLMIATGDLDKTINLRILLTIEMKVIVD
jgi:hypothetical protein